MEPSPAAVIAEELHSVHTIFPELAVDSTTRACSISLPIRLESPLKLLCNGLSVTIDYLPDILLHITLPEGYPTSQPPHVTISNVDKWLPLGAKQEILEELDGIWQTFKGSVIYNYIDYVKSNSELGFGIFSNDTLIIEDATTYETLIEENKLQIAKEFNDSYFTCEICQSDHKGLATIQFPGCNDTFCIPCLKDYFSHCIIRGEVENIHCPSFQCTQDYQNNKKELVKRIENNSISDFKTFDSHFFQLPIDKSVLLKIFATTDHETQLIEKFELLYSRSKMEQYRIFFPNRIAECPRSICSTIFIKMNPNSKLAICPTCKFAFCCDCFHSWHGCINPCSMFMKKLPLDVILEFIEHNGNEPSSKQSVEDKQIISNINFKYGRKIVELCVNEHIAETLFEDLILSGDANIIKCPHCLTYIQKADGCNKMTCSKCHVFFCNLCGDRLDRNDPYEHYNNPMNSCFGRLFQGMVVDGGEVLQ